MKRVLALLALVCALVLASACHYDVNISVDASAELIYVKEGIVSVPMKNAGTFHHNSLSQDDLEYIFVNLVKDYPDNFTTAFLRLEVYDGISDSHLRSEEYYVVYNSISGHYDFTPSDIP